MVLGWLSQSVWNITDGSASPKDSQGQHPIWLLVFDNTDNLEVLHDFWPESGNGSILVTSHDPLAKTRTHVSVAAGIDLDLFLPFEAGTLLAPSLRLWG